MKYKYIFLNFIVIFFLTNHVLFAEGPNEQDSQLTPEQATKLAIKYEKLAQHYKALADRLSDKKTQPTKKQDPCVKIKEKSPWDGTNATLGFQYNTGNTFQRNLSASSNINYRTNARWLQTLSMNYQNAFDYNQDTSTANKFFASGQSEYDFDKYNGIYFNVQYFNDQLSGYVYQLNENLGYKRLLYKDDKMHLTLFVGPGMQQTRQTQQTGGQFNNEPSVQVKTQYKWKLNNKTSYSQIIQWIKTPRHYTVGLTMALTTSIYDSFGLQPSFTLSYDSNPPTNTNGSQLKSLDTTTQLSFVYNF